MGYGLPEEIFAVFPVQLRIKAQFIFRQVRHAGLLTTQLETHFSAGKGLFEEYFSLLVALLYAAQEVFRAWRSYRIRWKVIMPKRQLACSPETTKPPAGGFVLCHQLLR